MNIKNKVEELSEIQNNIRDLKESAKKINSELYNSCMNLLKEVSEYEEIPDLEYLDSFEIRGDYIYFEGQDTFRGETDYYHFDIEVELLYDEQEKNKYFADLIKEKQDEEEAENQRKIEIEAKKKVQDRETYERLKKQFEQEGGE